MIDLVVVTLPKEQSDFAEFGDSDQQVALGQPSFGYQAEQQYREDRGPKGHPRVQGLACDCMIVSFIYSYR